MKEEWKIIKGWPNYEISSYGRIWRRSGFDTTGRWIDGRFLQPKTNGNIVLSDKPKKVKGYSIGRLVLLNFVGPPPSENENQARHLDDHRFNNHLSNLEWGSSYDNHQDRIRNGGTHKGIPWPQDVKDKISKGGRKFNKNNGIGLYTIFGETKLLSEWLEDSRCIISRGVFNARVGRQWSLEDTITVPKRDWKNGKYVRTLEERGTQ